MEIFIIVLLGCAQKVCRCPLAVEEVKEWIFQSPPLKNKTKPKKQLESEMIIKMSVACIQSLKGKISIETAQLCFPQISVHKALQ